MYAYKTMLRAKRAEFFLTCSEIHLQTYFWEFVGARAPYMDPSLVHVTASVISSTHLQIAICVRFSQLVENTETLAAYYHNQSCTAQITL